MFLRGRLGDGGLDEMRWRKGRVRVGEFVFSESIHAVICGFGL